MTDTLYRKRGRRYYPVGMEFTGFPADGIWQVVDGRQSLIVPVEHPRPLELARYTVHADDILKRVLERCRTSSGGYAYSIHDAVRWTLEELERIAAEGGERG